MANIHVLPQALVAEDIKPPENNPVAEHTVAASEVVRPPQMPAEPELIGASLEEIRLELMRHGERLAGLLTDAGTTFVQDALRVLESQTCRIAVVGQVKSGQSAFIGALVEQPDLLPREISPWSTAVTRLHFGGIGGPEGVAAEFQLFEDSDWERLASGSDKVRELTSRLVPGFEPELLRRHLDAMRQRSEQRFGDGFASILGGKHSHDAISRDVLARYLCPSKTAVAAEGAGQFADITRSADLYLPTGPFRFPSTVIATPGISDPFLVRDEITRHTLEDADLYIVVLSARQPLTTADLAVLRILRGLHKERLVVFIDHIDELRDAAGETRDLVADVRHTLAREFPSVEIPVVAGSARWANEALASDRLDVQKALTPAFVSYAKHKGVTWPVEVKAGGTGGDVSTGQLARGLSVCSGFPELKRALTGQIGQSHSAHLIRQIAAYFAELAQINEGSVGEDMHKYTASSDTDAAAISKDDEELQDVQGELVRIQAVAAELERKLASLQNLMGDVVAEQRSRLYQGLASILDAYARGEGDRLVLAFQDGRARRHWKCDCEPLRTRVQAELERAEQAAFARIAASEYTAFPALRDAILRMSPELELLPVPALTRDAGTPVPLMTAPIGETASLDLGASGPLVGWSRSRSPVEHAAELERLLVEALMPSIDEVTRLATGDLQRRVSLISERSTAISVAVIEALRRQSEGFIARAKELLDARDNRPAVEATRAEQLGALNERLAVAEALTRRLADVNARCEEMMA